MSKNKSRNNRETRKPKKVKNEPATGKVSRVREERNLLRRSQRRHTA